MQYIASANPQSTLTGSSIRGTASYETYVACQEESGCVYMRPVVDFTNILMHR